MPTRIIPFFQCYSEVWGKVNAKEFHYNPEIRLLFVVNFFYALGDFVVVPCAFVRSSPLPLVAFEWCHDLTRVCAVCVCVACVQFGFGVVTRTVPFIRLYVFVKLPPLLSLTVCSCTPGFLQRL